MLYLLTISGLLMAGLGAYLGNRTIPRFAAVAESYRLDVSPETAWVLGSGAIQPLPGCVLMVAGLIGVLAPRWATAMRVVGIVVLLAGLALLAATWAGLLLPEFVLV